MDIQALVDELVDRAGDLWLLALIGSFFVMICESAKPKLGEGESKAAPHGFALLIMILSLLTPLLLFIHAFATASGALIAIVVTIGGAILSAAIIGALIGAIAAPVGRVLNRAAPVLALPVFLLTVYVSWRSVLEFVNFIVASVVR